MTRICREVAIVEARDVDKENAVTYNVDEMNVHSEKARKLVSEKNAASFLFFSYICVCVPSYFFFGDSKRKNASAVCRKSCEPSAL